jgi:hypothetical protein
VHVKAVCNKLRSALTQIVKIKPVLNEKNFKNIYFSIVYPYLLYGITAWGFTTSGEMTKLKKLHVRILKIMKKGEKFNDSNNVYDYWQLLPFEMIVKYVFITQQKFIT